MEALGIAPFGLIAYIINFALLVVLLQMFLYKPIKGMLEQRQQRIDPEHGAPARPQAANGHQH